MIGQSKENIIELKNRGFNCNVFDNENLKDFQILAERI